MKRFLLVSLGAGAAIGAACGLPSEQADTDAPIVFITSPLADSTVGGTVAFSAQVFDGFGVASVKFMVDGRVVGEDVIEPFAVNWNTRGVGNGLHALRAEARDPAGNTGFTSISVTVDNTRQ